MLIDLSLLLLPLQMQQTSTPLECPVTVQHWRAWMSQTSQPWQQQQAAAAHLAAHQAAGAQQMTWGTRQEGLRMPQQWTWMLRCLACRR
jgi:hypothetical protein